MRSSLFINMLCMLRNSWKKCFFVLFSQIQDGRPNFFLDGHHRVTQPVILMYNTWGPTCLWAELQLQTHKTNRQRESPITVPDRLVAWPGEKKIVHICKFEDVSMPFSHQFGHWKCSPKKDFCIISNISCLPSAHAHSSIRLILILILINYREVDEDWGWYLVWSAWFEYDLCECECEMSRKNTFNKSFLTQQGQHGGHHYVYCRMSHGKIYISW